jgi:serine/threonine-protein kinase RsbW
MNPQHLSFSISATADAITHARHEIVAELRRWGPTSSCVVDAAGLVTSELLTNAVKHAGSGPITVVARRDGDSVRIEVDDTSPLRPHLRHADHDDEHGRGLAIVAALSSRHGVTVTGSGKRCWAEFFTGSAAVPPLSPSLETP